MDSMPSAADLQRMSPAEQRALLEKLLTQKSERNKTFPMSAGQQGLWHAFRRDPKATPFNVFLPTRVRSKIDVEAFHRAIDLLAKRHACLRTKFSDSNGELLQTVDDQLTPEFTVQDLSGISEVAAREIVVRETLRPFDLQHGPLLRLKLYRLADDDWIMLAITHHIVVDFWSLILILQEMRAAIPKFASGELPSLPPSVSNYADFVKHQAQLLAGPQGEKLKNYWQQVVENGSPVLELPLDRIRPTSFSGRAATAGLQFSAEISKRVQQFATQTNATPFSILHSALQVLLARYSQQDSFFIGSPFSGRTQRKYEPTVGFFVNMLPVHAQVSNSESFMQLASRTSQTLLAALEHEAYPISQIVHDSKIQRDPSRSPLFQVSCTYEKAQLQEESGRASFLFPDELQVWDFGGFRQESFYVPHQTCHYDLEFVFEQSADRIRGIIVYCRDLFDAGTLELMSRNFETLLTALLANADRPLGEVNWSAPADEVTDQATSVHHTDAAAPSIQTVHELIAASAERSPESTAMIDQGIAIRYADLLSQADCIRKSLQQRGLGRGDLIPVVAQRGMPAWIAILGVQLSGAAPIPIDANQPSLDAQTLIEDSNARVILCDSFADLDPNRKNHPTSVSVKAAHGFSDRLLESGFNGEVLKIADLLGNPSVATATTQANVQAQELAYVIYTSGSTGKPKGVMVEHAAVCNTLAWRMKDVTLDRNDHVLLLLSHQFDAGLGMAWTTLTQGATLVFAAEGSSLDPNQIIDQILRDRISVLPIVPSLLRLLLEHPRFRECTSLRFIWTGGESLPPDLPSLVRQLTLARIWNFYGPTEAAIEATAYDATDHPATHRMTIGRAIANTEILVLSQSGKNRSLQPDGVPGELAIAGPGLARGYLNEPQLTSQKFVSVQRSDRTLLRLYLTGDRGRRLPDGRIEFLGRTDHQIKLRGYRIELGEIESVLEQHPEVNRVAVKLLQENSPAAHLVAFVSPVDASVRQSELGQQSFLARLRRFADDRLAVYKVPAAVVLVEHMPMTSSGKVDRKKLPDEVAIATPHEQKIAPRTAIEAYLAEQWRHILAVPELSVDTNFFDAGGSSLQAAMLTSRLSADLDVHIPTSLLFDLADISQVALRLIQLHPEMMEGRFGPATLDQQLQLSSDSRVQRFVHPLLAELKPTGRRNPIFMVHPPGGIVVCYHELAKHLPTEQPFYGIRSRGLHGEEEMPATIEAMAAEYLEAMRSVQTAGPYVVGGWSLGGLVAYEIAQQLLSRGEAVQLLLLDTTIPENSSPLVPASEQVSVGLEYGIELSLDQLGELSPEEQLPFLWQHAKNLGVIEDQSPAEVVQQILVELQGLFHHHVQLARQYRLQPLAAHIDLFRPTDVPFELPVAGDRGWRHLARSVQVVFVPGHHHSMVQLPHVQELANAIAASKSLQLEPATSQTACCEASKQGGE